MPGRPSDTHSLVEFALWLRAQGRPLVAGSLLEIAGTASAELGRGLSAEIFGARRDHRHVGRHLRSARGTWRGTDAGRTVRPLSAPGGEEEGTLSWSEHSPSPMQAIDVHWPTPEHRTVPLRV